MKYIFISVILHLFCCSVQAQFVIGARAGGNFSTYIGKDVEGSNGVFGYHAGLYSRLTTSDNEFWQPEILFSTKGSRYEDYTVDAVQKMYCIDVPVLYHFVKESGHGFLIGPQISTLLKVDGETTVGTRMTNMQKVYDNYAFKRLDYGLVAGFIINVEDKVSVEGRLSIGLLNFIDNKLLDGDKLSGRIMNIQLSVGWNN